MFCRIPGPTITQFQLGVSGVQKMSQSSSWISWICKYEIFILLSRHNMKIMSFLCMNVETRSSLFPRLMKTPLKWPRIMIDWVVLFPVYVYSIISKVSQPTSTNVFLIFQTREHYDFQPGQVPVDEDYWDWYFLSGTSVYTAKYTRGRKTTCLKYSQKNQYYGWLLLLCCFLLLLLCLFPDLSNMKHMNWETAWGWAVPSST